MSQWPGFNEVVGLLLLLLAAICLLALGSHHPADPTWFQQLSSPAPVRNVFGRVGANLSELLWQGLGTAAWLVPLVLGITGWNRFRGRGAATSWGRFAGLAAATLVLTGLLQLWIGWVEIAGERYSAGGLAGIVVGGALRELLGTTGGIVVAVVLLAATIVLATQFSFARTGEALVVWGREETARRVAAWRARREEKRRADERTAVSRKHAKAAAERAKDAPAEEPQETPRAAPAPPALKPRPTPPKPAPAAKQAPLLEPQGTSGMSLPPLDLLNDPKPQPSEDEKELLSRAGQLTQKFREFDVEGEVVAIHPGPVVTTFEFKPDAGVKYSKITGLVDDLCLGLKAESVRIDRMPGRATVGIEVPNKHQEIIYPKELMGSDRWRQSRSKLTLALGKDINGEVYTAELDRMPHLLIAGATGAGKSVGLNGMIVSMLYKSTPAEVRFIMIDTKMIELGIYQDIPHLLIPVVTDPKHASTALKWAVREMESRYKKLAAVGVRNLEQFNALLDAEPERTISDPKTGESQPLRKLPCVVIVIDEMADLMMVSSADVEESIMRLAQMARAVGIHLILATQRPSVDVITGTIKANFPSRIAFRVSQRVDSRTIIDQQGAEHLLGRGDMLFMPPGSQRLTRLHSAYLTEGEINRITAFLKKQAKPVYDESVLKDPEEERAAGGDGGERDAMYLECVRLVLQEGQCSITLLQRRLRLGYARAARIVDTMQQDGIVGPADGSKPREILVGPEILETLSASR
jgi:S-DNA-T family DNA segregation ATPase FtsK/SpoIIIE